MPELQGWEDEGAGPGTVGDVAAAAPRGLAKGVVGLAGMPGDMLSMANKAGDWVNEKLGVSSPKGGTPGDSSNPFVPTSEQLRSTVEELTGAWGEAKTAPGKYMESVTSMIPSVMLGGGGLLAKGATAIGGGVGAEAGGELSSLAGFGEAPGKIAGGMLGGGVGGAAIAARTARPNFEETFATFQRLGLNPTAATTGVGGQAAKWAESNVLPQAIGGANRMHKIMEENLARFTEKQQDIAAQFGAPKRKVEAGKDMQDALLGGWQKQRKEAEGIFTAIGQAFGPNDRFVPDNLFKTVHKPVGSADTAAVKAYTDAAELRETDDILTAANGTLTYADMKALKTKFGDMLDPSYAKPVNKAQVSQLVSALDKDIESTIKSIGNPDVLRDWQYAKATYNNAMKDYEQAFKKLLGTKDMPVRPEKVYEIMMGQAGIKSSADIEAFKKVWPVLGKEKQGELSATVLTHMGNKDPDKLGDLEGFSMSTFLTNYKNLSADAKHMMFKQTGNVDLEKSLDDLLHVANKMGVWKQLESTSKSGTFGGMAMQLAAPFVYTASGHFAEAAKAALLNIGGPAAASKMLTNPKWVRRIAYAMDQVHGGLTGSTKALLGIVSQAQQEGLGPPQENSGGGNQIPSFAEGGIVTKPTVAMIGEKGPEMVVPLTEKGMGNVGGGFNRSPGGMGGIAKNRLEMGGGLRQGLGQLGQKVGEQQAQGRQQNVMSEFQNMEGMFGNWLQQLMSKFPGAEAALAKYGIPGLADGGVVTEPTVAMLGEKGPEAVIPLSEPAMAQQAAEAAAARTRAPYAAAAARPTGLLEGLDELGGYFSNKLTSALTAPRDALTGAMPVTDPATGMPTPQAMQRGQGIANLAMTGGIPMAQRGAAGMAGGKLPQPPKPGDRINFQSAGAQRGEPVPGAPRPEPGKKSVGDLTPEEKAEWKKRADAEMQAHLEKMSKTKEGRKIITDLAKKIENETSGERIGFKSLKTEKPN